MIGAFIGDIAGSVFEFNNCKSKDIELMGGGCRFTDDSVMTAAVAAACLDYADDRNMEHFESGVSRYMRLLGRKYIDAGYGGRFLKWLMSDDMGAYYSYGNGSAMRVSPVAYAARKLSEAETLGEVSARVTHDHPEGIKGARAVAAAVFMALHGASKEEIRAYIESGYYKIGFTLDEIRDTYTFDVSCQGSVPQALEAFFEAESFEDAIRNAISIGGDSDTIACIAGSIAGAFFGVPDDLKNKALDFIAGTDLYAIYKDFCAKFAR